ncbi:hypothetical protein [Hyperthermus butylicus]|nr:hypothetical protein [Hyperthermus butylicus]
MAWGRVGVTGLVALSFIVLLVVSSVSPLLASVAAAEETNTTQTTDNTTIANANLTVINTSVAGNATVEAEAGAETTASSESIAVNVRVGVSVSAPGTEFGMMLTRLDNVTLGKARALVMVYSGMMRSALARLGLLNATPEQIAEALDVPPEYAAAIYNTARVVSQQLDSMTDEQVMQLLHEVMAAHKILVDRVKEMAERAAERIKEKIQQRVMEHIARTVEKIARQLNDTELARLAQQLRNMSRLGNYTAANITRLMKDVVARIEAHNTFMLAMRMDDAVMKQLVRLANTANVTDPVRYMVKLQKSLAKAIKLLEHVRVRLQETGAGPEAREVVQTALGNMAGVNETVQQVMAMAKIYARVGVNKTSVALEAVKAAFTARIDRLASRANMLAEEIAMLMNLVDNPKALDLLHDAREELAEANSTLAKARVALEQGNLVGAVKLLTDVERSLAKAEMYIGRVHGHLVKAVIEQSQHGREVLGEEQHRRIISNETLAKLKIRIEAKIREAKRLINQSIQVIYQVNDNEARKETLDKLHDAQEELHEALASLEQAEEKLAKGDIAEALELYREALEKAVKAIHKVKLSTQIAKMYMNLVKTMAKMHHEEKHEKKAEEAKEKAEEKRREAP